MVFEMVGTLGFSVDEIPVNTAREAEDFFAQ